MKKILLVTKTGKNYGALLQAYALKTVLEQLEYDVNILNLNLERNRKSFSVLVRPSGLRSIPGFIRSLIRAAKTKESVRKCLDFREKYYAFTKPYRNIGELQADPPEADIYLVGSDQVWNPILDFSPAYFLMFGDKNTMRASYAASIGFNQYPKEYEAEFCERLKNIPYKSVREPEAQEILDSYGFPSEVHADPTLLLSSADYDQIAITPKITRPYILLYLVGPVKKYNNIQKALKALYPDKLILNIPDRASRVKYADREAADIGPEEFIGLIKHADAVVTASFHGTVFSLLYHKNFISLAPNKTASRISNLLEMTGLSDRLSDDFSKLDKLFELPDFSRADKVLAVKREEGIQYLQSLGSKE